MPSEHTVNGIKIPMKEVVRMALKKMHEGDEFTIKKLALEISVKDKAISNEITGMVQFGALEQNKDPRTKHITYKIVKNTLSAFYMKYPKGSIHIAKIDGTKYNGKHVANRPKSHGNGLAVNKVETGGPRTGLARIAMDGKIQEFKAQIKELTKKVEALQLAKSLI